jgi:hypothetical protein
VLKDEIRGKKIIFFKKSKKKFFGWIEMTGMEPK